MFQSFENRADASQGAARLTRLREQLQKEGLAGFLIPRADVHQGEYCAPHDERLSWLTGFTGSAGFCAALTHGAGVFIDGRYRTQVKEQVDTAAFTPVPWPEVQLKDWLKQELPEGGVIGFDAWLHVAQEIETLEAELGSMGFVFRPTANLVDQIWQDQPAPPAGMIEPYPEALAGESHASKRTRLSTELRAKGQSAAVITLPDSIAWLLNIRGSDIPRNPVPHAFAILFDTGQVSLFVDSAKISDELRLHLGSDINIRPPSALLPTLHSLRGAVRVDRSSAPLRIALELNEAQATITWEEDPCILPKARKTKAEIAGTQQAHLRDGAAMVEFLTWLDAQAPDTITEIDVVTALEAFRSAGSDLLDISFETIAGTGPHGAIMHYRVTEESNATLKNGEIIVIDSGGQYIDGTTDITRTVPIGQVGDAQKAAFTRVLQGMIAISRLRFPKGLAGRDLDAIARYPLWLAGLDFNHGTGHGVGVYLCVHEGPQRLSRVSHTPLEAGMILSNEPGYYREGAFGIRIENLIVVQEASQLDGADARDMNEFLTLTYVPIDRRLIDVELLSKGEREWLDSYHATCRLKLDSRLSEAARLWHHAATEPL
ncbi:aminopeptidase P family protein [Lentibacter algarum]|uniref:aminopeptidase P family protein n=1 Tax=Lentibacter algarum TaxID=576131 RepID=UPI001C0869B9|nr:aminopeptidase P family protein [Lentibacter algarum]MBU2982860.1 aminopeptidase P family protein [Lentibacter algarum]